MADANRSQLAERIYLLVKQIPEGQVATYGQLAKMVGRCGPRQVGQVMSKTPPNQSIPWQRVVNSQGRISVRKEGGVDPRQLALLKAEGVIFNQSGKLDLLEYGWLGPDWEWLQENDYVAVLPPGFEEV